ncbi:MAG: hypothetical protein ACTHN5_09535 [Phycisphaerae bacterium]
MIKFYKFRQELFAPAPAREILHKPGKGKGWPEECPPIRGANGFGYDLLANFDLDFRYSRGGGGKWILQKPLTLASDFDWSPDDQTPGRPLTQDYAWFWEKGQKLPHVISDNVYDIIKHQVKVQTFLYLATDPNELLLITDIPNLNRPFRAVSALVETDWYPANYPWHCVLELDPARGGAKRIQIKKGEPLCRIIPVRRDAYFAKQMDPAEFDAFFDRGQRWLQKHGKPHGHGEETPVAKATLDITRTYVRQQAKSTFHVIE